MSEHKVALVFTGSEDPMWPFLLEACSTLERKALILFPTDRPDQAQMTYDPVTGQVWFLINGEGIDGSRVQGVWWRRTISPDFDHLASDLRDYCLKEYLVFWEGLEYALPMAQWVSRPSAIKLAENKALQLRLANELQLRTLATILTNSPAHAGEFMAERQSIYKAIGCPRIPLYEDRHSTVFTTLLENQHLHEIDGIQTCPGIFQSFCQKRADIRVTIFDSSAFTVRIESQEGTDSKVDFRRGARHLPHEIHTLPPDIEMKCVQMVQRLGLRYGAIDLALLDDETYIFFEINPNGQWGWLEEKTGLPMRRALLNSLFGAR